MCIQATRGLTPFCLRCFLKTVYIYVTPCKIIKTCHQVPNHSEFPPSYDHIKKIKGKTEAALQMIFTLAGNEEFHNIEMSTIWKLLDTCIISIITYGAEAWTTTKAEENALQKILDNIIKRIIKTPTTTPSELTTAETGIWDIETQVMKTQIMYYHKIVNTRPKESTLYKVTTDPDNPWKKKITNTLRKINITETEFLEKNKKTSKNNCHPEAK